MPKDDVGNSGTNVCSVNDVITADVTVVASQPSMVNDVITADFTGVASQRSMALRGSRVALQQGPQFFNCSNITVNYHFQA